MSQIKTPLPLYIFWDNSNLFISAQSVCMNKEYMENRKQLRLYFPNILLLAHANRPVTKVVAIGSAYKDQDIEWRNKMEDMRQEMPVNFIIQERGDTTNTEQGVDQTLQLNMYRTLCREAFPGIAVLLTGDGRGDFEDEGFLKTLQDMHAKGWGVEVLAWNSTCSRNLKHWAWENGVFVAMEKYYYSLTFMEGGRIAEPLSLKSRKLSLPNQNENNALEALKKKYEAEKASSAIVMESQRKQIAQLTQENNDLKTKLVKYEKTEKYKKRVKNRMAK